MRFRRASAAVLLGFVFLTIAACHRRSVQPVGAPTEIVFIHSKIPGVTYLKDIVRDFEQAYPNIHVREELLPSNSDDQHQFYVINLPAGAAEFDVIDMDVIWVPEFARAGWIEELTDQVPPAELAQLNRSALEADWLQGKLYGVPWFVDLGVLYYRGDLLAKYGFEPPATYEEVARISRAVLDGENDPRLAGFLWQGQQYEGLVCVALEMIRGNGGAILNAEGVPALLQPATLSALTFLSDLVRTRASPPSVTTFNEEATRHLFESGRAVFMRNWPYAWPLLNQPDSPVAGRVGVTSIPHFAGHASAPTLGGFHLGINRHSLHKREAAEFLRFMIRKQTQKKIALQLGFVPANTEVYADPEVRQRLTILPFLQDSLRRLAPRPISPYYLMISQILQPEFSAVVAGIRSPREAMQSAQQQILHLIGEQ